MLCRPWVTIYPHNHNIWAVIGIYSGREGNMFWRRIDEDSQGRIEAVGARSLCLGDVTSRVNNFSKLIAIIREGVFPARIILELNALF